jgi:hypothetical protein
VENVIGLVVSFILGIVGTLLVEWRFRPKFERKRRAQERWENELQELLELLEIRLPRQAEELNRLLGIASWYDEVRDVEDLTTAQRDAVAQMAEDDRETTQRAYEAWQDRAQTATVLTRRIARFHQQDKTTTYEISGSLYSKLYTVQVSEFRRGEIPSGDYEQKEKDLRTRLQEWAESLLREGRPLKKPRRPSVRPDDIVTHVTRCPPRRT